LGALMEAHSQIDWPTLLAGALLGVPITIVVTYAISILAYFHAPRLQQFLHNRRLLKQTKTKTQALVEFNRIKSFRDGTRDRYPFYILLASGSILSAIFSSTLFIIFSFQSGNVYPVSPEYGAVAIVATLVVVLAVVFPMAIYDTAIKIERFDAYKLEFEKRWGSVDDAEVPDSRQANESSV
jgi:hypothetical protein